MGVMINKFSLVFGIIFPSLRLCLFVGRPRGCLFFLLLDVGSKFPKGCFDCGCLQEGIVYGWAGGVMVPSTTTSLETTLKHKNTLLTKIADVSQMNH